MSEIDKKTRADLFRKRIEDKNTLTGAGAIYVGTGKKTEIPNTKMTVGNAEVTGAYYETVGVTPTAVGQVPVSVSGTGTAGVAGLEFKSATGIFDGTPDPIRMIATGKGTDGNVRIVSNNDVMISALHDLTIGTDGGTGTSYLSGKLRLENRENTDRTKWPYIEVDSKSVIINGETKTKISNISLDTNLKGPVTGSLYIAPSGSASLDVNGATGIYSSGTEETNLAPIIYNIGQRLDSLGFKEEVVEDSFGDNLLTFRKIGYYVLVTLEQSISVVWEADDFYCNVPQAFQKQKKETKTLFSIYLKASDRYLDTVVSISYRIDDSEHTIEFKNQDAIYNPCIDARFNKGIIFGYDIRE